MTPGFRRVESSSGFCESFPCEQFGFNHSSASEEVVVGGEVPVAASEEVVITNNVDLPIEGSLLLLMAAGYFCRTNHS